MTTTHTGTGRKPGPFTGTAVLLIFFCSVTLSLFLSSIHSSNEAIRARASYKQATATIDSLEREMRRLLPIAMLKWSGRPFLIYVFDTNADTVVAIYSEKTR